MGTAPVTAAAVPAPAPAPAKRRTRPREPVLDLAGQRFGMLVAIERAQGGGRAAWHVRCDCGTERIVRQDCLRQAVTRSCGCATAELRSKAMTSSQTANPTPRGPVRLPLAMPRTRGDCADVPRPCPHATCRHHLGAERRRDPAPPGTPTCSLDLADLGGQTLDQVGKTLGVTRERVRQLEKISLWSLASKLRRRGIITDGPLDVVKRLRDALGTPRERPDAIDPPAAASD